MKKPVSPRLSVSPLRLPSGLTEAKKAYPVYFVNLAQSDLKESKTIKKVNEAIFEVLCRIHVPEIRGKTLLKVHVGEPKCTTRMRPEFVAGSTRFLQYRGATSVVAGDTTVAYSGPRGHRQNPVGKTAKYVNLARAHGWSVSGPAGVPFVVLDRPSTAIPSAFEFQKEQDCIKLRNIRRFTDFFPAGGFLEADFLINHAHLTLHGLAGLAGCIKSIAMGCSALNGKLRMHKSLLPLFNFTLCKKCGLCARNCPEEALVVGAEDKTPALIAEKCIGCGECVAVCANRAVQLRGSDISDWKRGEKTLPERMVDYTLGLMQGRWERIIHVLHMYTITELCDCVDKKQVPIVHDLGFLLSKNPFAIDKTAALLLAQSLEPDQMKINAEKFAAAEATADYVKKNYRIVTDAPLYTIFLTDAAVGKASSLSGIS
jgi:uncharacterized Fe-S center protein